MHCSLCLRHCQVLMFSRSILPCKVKTCWFALKIQMGYPSSFPPLSCEATSPTFSFIGHMWYFATLHELWKSFPPGRDGTLLFHLLGACSSVMIQAHLEGNVHNLSTSTICQMQF